MALSVVLALAGQLIAMKTITTAQTNLDMFRISDAQPRASIPHLGDAYGGDFGYG
ncbi:MAG TPA: hypothetical protein VN737_10235 [Bryobacteraceae bacterium]|jgi:hypothetical protein|nr:hypothetical protein [Bryobacteraceae bacterium]